MALNKQQQGVLVAARGYNKAKGSMIRAFKELCGDDLSTDEAKKLVSDLLTAVRTIGGVVASVKACSEAKAGPMCSAGKDYWAISKAFSRAKAETAETPERAEVGFADSILKDAARIIARIQKAKPEKLTFEATAAIAAFQVAMNKIRK